MVDEARALAQNAYDLANQALNRKITCPDGGCPLLQELITRVDRLEHGLYDDVGSFAFTVDFYTLEDKTITAGIWNETAGRLEC